MSDENLNWTMERLVRRKVRRPLQGEKGGTSWLLGQSVMMFHHVVLGSLEVTVSRSERYAAVLAGWEPTQLVAATKLFSTLHELDRVHLV